LFEKVLGEVGQFLPYSRLYRLFVFELFTQQELLLLTKFADDVAQLILGFLYLVKVQFDELAVIGYLLANISYGTHLKFICAPVIVELDLFAFFLYTQFLLPVVE
jgi:hypothetical protein